MKSITGAIKDLFKDNKGEGKGGGALALIGGAVGASIFIVLVLLVLGVFVQILGLFGIYPLAILGWTGGPTIITGPTPTTTTTISGGTPDKTFYVYGVTYSAGNTSATEYFDAKVDILQGPCTNWETSMKVGNISTGTGGDFSATNRQSINFGKVYCLVPIAQDGANNDNSQIAAITTGSDCRLVDGKAEISVTDPNKEFLYCTMSIYQHGTLEARAWDNQEAGWIFGTGGPANTWNTTGTSFKSTTNNTAIDVTSTGHLDITYEIRAVEADTRFTDYETLILFDADVSDWAEPTQTLNGVKLTDIADAKLATGETVVKSDESKSYSAYEYAYLVTEPFDHTISTLRMHMEPESGVNPDMDPIMSFTTRGMFESIEPNRLGYGAVKDDSSRTQVYTIQTFTQDIS